MRADLKEIGDAVVVSVKGYVGKALAGLAARLDDFDDRLKDMPKPEKGDRGEDADPELIRQEVAKAVAEIPRPKDGESVDLVALSVEIAAAAAKAVSALPVPKDGKDFDPEEFEAAVKHAVAEIPRPADGKDADVAEIAAEVLEQVTKALEKIPAPKDGKDAEPVDVDALVARIVAQVPKPKDAEPVNLDEIVGLVVAELPEPKEVRDGKDADPELIRAEVEKAVAAIPKPKDGESVPTEDVQRMVDAAVSKAVETIRVPEDGRDAMQIDVLDGIDESKSYLRGTCAAHRGGTIRAYRATDPIGDSLEKSGWHVVFNGVAEEQETTADDGRTVERVTVYTNGKRFVRQHKFSVVIDRGVFHEGQKYQKGDGVTWARHYWIAQTDTESKPEPGSDWRLAVKSGRDGRDCKDKGTV